MTGRLQNTEKDKALIKSDQEEQNQETEKTERKKIYKNNTAVTISSLVSFFRSWIVFLLMLQMGWQMFISLGSILQILLVHF